MNPQVPQHANAIPGFEGVENPFPSHAEHVRVWPCQVASWELRELLPEVVHRCGYSEFSLDPHQNYARAVHSEVMPGRLGLQIRRVIEIAWATGSPVDDQTPVRDDLVVASWVVYDDTNAPPFRYFEPAADDFGDKLVQLVGTRIRSRKPTAPPRDLVLGPGETLDSSFYARAARFALGSVRDYSGCATPEELQSLRTGDLLIGRSMAFGTATEGIETGDDLFLGAQELANGTLVCGSPQSGKTALLVRWALEANRNGSSVVAIDGNGNLSAGIRSYVCGPVYRISQRGRDSDRIDFLAAGDGDSSFRALEQIELLVEALLPDVAGNPPANLAEHRVWMTALIQLLKLKAPGDSPELSDLYAVVTDEERFDALVAAAPPGATRWIKDVAGLMDRVRHEGTGRRDPEQFFEDLARPLADALKFFAGFRTDTGRLVRLDALLDPRTGPFTVIVEAMDDDGDKAAALVRAVAVKLKQMLGDREGGPKNRLLVIVDELRAVPVAVLRIIAGAARQARTACVQATSSLDRLADRPEKILEAMAEFGGQVFLRGLPPNSARYLMEALPKRRRQSVKGGSGLDAASGQVEHLDLSWEYNQDYFTTQELSAFPGLWPALVIRQSRGKPFLVDCLARSWIATPVDGAGSLALENALQRARAGDIVLAQPGVYRGSAITRPGVILAGDGEPGGVVLEIPGYVAVRHDAGTAVVKNVTMRIQPRDQNPDVLVSAIYVGGGTLIIDRCHATSLTGQAVYAAGAGTKIRLFDSTFSSANSIAVELAAASQGEANGCTITGTGMSGVFGDGAGGVFRNCVVRGSKVAGIAWSGAGAVELSDCTLDGNGGAGLEVNAGASAHAVRCRFERNGTGVYALNGGSAAIEHGVFEGNGETIDAATVLVLADSRSSLSDCRIRSRERAGVCASGENARADLDNCDVAGCGQAGVIADSNAVVAVRRSRLQKNRFGAATTQGGKIILTMCDVSENAEGAFAPDSAIEVHENGAHDA